MEQGSKFQILPPKAADDDNKSTDFENDFSQMGFRTPAVVVSPYTRNGGVWPGGPYGHESILKLIEYRFGLNALTKRDGSAFMM